MNVAELIEKLREMPQDEEVIDEFFAPITKVEYILPGCGVGWFHQGWGRPEKCRSQV